MNILQVIPYFAPAWIYGGPVNVCYNTCLELANRGHEVSVYTTDSLDEYSRVGGNLRTVSKEGIRIHYFRNISNWLAFKHHLFISPKLINVAKSEVKNFDIIHIQEYRTFQSVVIHRYAQEYDVPYILQAHGSMPRRLQKQRLKRIFDQVVGYRILRDASKVIAVTDREKSQYLEFGVAKSKIEVIPNGFALFGKKSIPQKGEFRREYSLSGGNRIILFMGRINKIKGLDLLIEAFHELIKKRDNLTLVIAGPNDGFLDVLRKQISSYNLDQQVVFTGFLEGKSKVSALVDSDIFVLSSYDEGLSMAVLEACSLMTPVVVSEAANVSGIEEYAAGIIFKNGDKEGLVNALLMFLDNEPIRERYAENARKMVAERFTLAKQVDRLEEVYRRCIEERR